MGALAKFFSLADKLLASLFLTFLPEVLRLIVLVVCVLWKYYKLLSSYYKYTSMMNRKSSKFIYRDIEDKPDYRDCTICLSEFQEGEEGRKLLDCKHTFHKHCLEQWLQGYKATCPLCRNSVLPDVIVAEYRTVRNDQENYRIEKQLASVLLKWWNLS